MYHRKSETINHGKRISNIKLFIDLYNWKSIGYPTVINDTNYTVTETMIQKLI